MTKKQIRLVISILTALLGLAIVITSSIYLAKSVSVWADEWGTDIDLNKDFIIFIMAGLGLLGAGSYGSYLSVKEECPSFSLMVGYTFGGVIVFLYSLAMIIKQVQKEHEDMMAVLTPYIAYLVVGLIVAVGAYLVYRTIKSKKAIEE